MNRPFPLPSDVKHARAATHVHRAAAAHLRSFVTGATPSNAARAMFGNDIVTDLVLRAATTPAAISGTAGWAQALGGVAIYDLIQSITSQSTGAALIDRALQLNMDGLAELRIPGRTVSAAAAGQWVAEGAPVPVRQMSFSNSAILRPRKLAVISVFTREMAESSNIEAIVRQTLGEAVGLALDVKMFSTDAASASAPAGLFNGVSALTATAGGGDNAMHGDLANLFGALGSAGAGKTAVIVAALPQAVRLKSSLGPLWDYSILASTALAAGTVAAIEAASFVSGFGSTAEFSVSKVAALHMDDTSPQDITAGSPSRSMFQIDAIALRTDLWASFGLRAAGHAQFMTGATW